MRIKAFFGKVSFSFSIFAGVFAMFAEYWDMLRKAGDEGFLHPKLYSIMHAWGMASKNDELVYQPKDPMSFTDADIIQIMFALTIIFASWGLILAFISRFRKEHSLFYSCSLVLCAASAFYLNNAVGIILIALLAVYVMCLESLIGKYV